MNGLNACSGRGNRMRWAPAVVVALGLTASASAQFGLSPSISSAFRQAITTRDIQLAVADLQLDENQRFILETLFADYQADFRTGVEGFRQRITDLRSEIDPTNPDPAQAMRIVFGSMDQWQVESQQLADRLVEDLKGLLSEEQQEFWPPFERRVFRLKFLNKGRLSGESLDLFSAVRRLNLDETLMQTIQPLLDEYGRTLHEALRAREDYLNAAESDRIKAIQNRKPAMSVVVAAREVQLRTAVRDVNEQYSVIIAGALPEETGQRLVASIRERMYPRIYRLTPAQRVFKAVKKLDGLSEEIFEAIESLEELFLSELGSFNERLVGLIKEQQPSELKSKLEQVAARGAQSKPTGDAVREEFRKRRAMSDRYVNQLRDLLTPEQFASLPGSARWVEPARRSRAKGAAGKDGGTADDARRKLRLEREKKKEKAGGKADSVAGYAAGGKSPTGQGNDKE
ncbi:MAG: hypothetical protein IH983_05735 [Planctomycetes bacterium]|nr:hypothetical protein [Planctomycetota bacterium]